MTKKRSLEDKITDTENKMKQLQAQLQKDRQALKEKERKERTRRLIQIGGIFASIGIDTVELADKIKNEMIKNKETKKLLSNMGITYNETKPDEEKEINKNE